MKSKFDDLTEAMAARGHRYAGDITVKKLDGTQEYSVKYRVKGAPLMYVTMDHAGRLVVEDVDEYERSFKLKDSLENLDELLAKFIEKPWRTLKQ